MYREGERDRGPYGKEGETGHGVMAEKTEAINCSPECLRRRSGHRGVHEGSPESARGRGIAKKKVGMLLGGGASSGLCTIGLGARQTSGKGRLRTW